MSQTPGYLHIGYLGCKQMRAVRVSQPVKGDVEAVGLREFRESFADSIVFVRLVFALLSKGQIYQKQEVEM